MPVQVIVMCDVNQCQESYKSGTSNVVMAMDRARSAGWTINRILESWCPKHANMTKPG